MVDGVKVKYRNTGRLFQRLRRWGDAAIKGVESAMFIEAEQIIAAAKGITPVDLGNLRASGHVQFPVVTASSIKVEFGFGGPAGSGNQGGESNDEDVGYAVTVHEDLEAFHTVGQAKYLETPLNERKSGMAGRIARRAERRAKQIASRAR